MAWTSRNWKPIPDTGKRFPNPQKHPNQLWDQPTLLFSGYHEYLFTWGAKQARARSWPINLLPRLSICVFKCHWPAQNNFSSTSDTYGASILNDPNCRSLVSESWYTLCTYADSFPYCLMERLWGLYESYAVTTLHIQWGGADKSLAQPGTKHAIATKLGIYSTCSPWSSIHFLAHCSKFL
jgi:hypothetical protein